MGFMGIIGPAGAGIVGAIVVATFAGGFGAAKGVGIVGAGIIGAVAAPMGALPNGFCGAFGTSFLLWTAGAAAAAGEWHQFAGAPGFGGQGAWAKADAAKNRLRTAAMRACLTSFS